MILFAVGVAWPSGPSCTTPANSRRERAVRRDAGKNTSASHGLGISSLQKKGKRSHSPVGKLYPRMCACV